MLELIELIELIYEYAALILTVAVVCWYIWEYRPLKRTVEGLARLLDAVTRSDVKILVEKNIFFIDTPYFATLTPYGKELARLIAAETIAKEYYEQVFRKENAYGYIQEASPRPWEEQEPRFVTTEQMKSIQTELTTLRGAPFRFPVEEEPMFYTHRHKAFIDAMQDASFEFATEQLPRLVTKTQMKLIDDAASNAGVKRNEILQIIGIAMRDILLGGGLKKVKGAHG